MLWLKYEFFKQGIGPNEFKKAQMRDIKDIIDIENEINERKQREGAVQDAIANLGR